MIRAIPSHHTVQVILDCEQHDGARGVEWWLDAVRLICTAPAWAPCRTYPDCGCEIITAGENPDEDQYGHPFVPGQECWVKAWFDAEDLASMTTYTGSDSCKDTECGLPVVHKIGHIKIVRFSIETGPEWEWA